MSAPAFPALRSARLVLREIGAADADALYAIHGDAEHMRWFGVDALPDRAAAEKLVATFAGWREQPNPGVRWGLEVSGHPGLIGSCGLFGWNRNWKKCSVGYELAPSAQGQGYMHEALRAAIEWGWAEMALNRIEAGVHPDNRASLKLLQRLGFRQEGLARQQGYWRGQFHDMCQLALLRQDWAAAQGRPSSS